MCQMGQFGRHDDLTENLNCKTQTLDRRLETASRTALLFSFPSRTLTEVEIEIEA